MGRLELAMSVFGGSGYNPRVVRIVEFEDGSTSYLNYRTMAHQPFMRWLKGKEFNPRVGERYEVKDNKLVRKVE